MILVLTLSRRLYTTRNLRAVSRTQVFHFPVITADIDEFIIDLRVVSPTSGQRGVPGPHDGVPDGEARPERHALSRAAVVPNPQGRRRRGRTAGGLRALPGECALPRLTVRELA